MSTRPHETWMFPSLSLSFKLEIVACCLMVVCLKCVEFLLLASLVLLYFSWRGQQTSNAVSRHTLLVFILIHINILPPILLLGTRPLIVDFGTTAPCLLQLKGRSRLHELVDLIFTFGLQVSRIGLQIRTRLWIVHLR